MIFNRGKGMRGLSLVLASTLALTPAASLAQQPVQSALTTLIPGYERISEEGECRDALSGFLIEMQSDLRSAVEEGNAWKLMDEYGDFFYEFLQAAYDGMAREQFGILAKNLSNAQLKKLIYLQGKRDPLRLRQYEALDDLVQRVSINVEKNPYSDEDKTPTFTIPINFGPVRNEESEFRVFIEFLGGFWQVKQVYHEEHEPEKDFVRTMYDKYKPPKRSASAGLTPEQAKKEARHQQILSNLAANGYDIEELQRRKERGESISDLIRDANARMAKSDQSATRRPENSENVNIGDIAYDVELDGKKFNYCIDDAFILRMNETQAQGHSSQGSGNSIYEWVITRNRASSSSGKGAEFVNGNALILWDANGNRIVPYMKLTSSDTKDIPWDCRNPPFNERLSSILNEGELSLHTTENSEGVLYMAYLLSCGTAWTSSEGVPDYLSRYYEIKNPSQTLYLLGENGKGILIPAPNQLQVRTLDDLK